MPLVPAPLRTLSQVGPKLSAAMAHERLSHRLRRHHLVMVDRLGERAMRRLLGDPIVVPVDDLLVQGPFESRWMLARLKGGIYEPLEMALFRAEIKPGMVVLDIGANIGIYSMLASRRVGENGRVYAFEPDPRNSAHLLENLRVNGCANVTHVDKAVSDGAGRHVFRMASRPTDSSMFPSMGDMPITATIEVETTAVDAMPFDGRVVDVVKMDVEGGEPAAVRGMLQTLRANPGAKMFVEFEPPALLAAGRSPVEFLQDLRDVFREVSVIDEARREVVPVAQASTGLTQSLYCSGVRTE